MASSLHGSHDDRVSPCALIISFRITVEHGNTKSLVDLCHFEVVNRGVSNVGVVVTLIGMILTTQIHDFVDIWGGGQERELSMTGSVNPRVVSRA